MAPERNNGKGISINQNDDVCGGDYGDYEGEGEGDEEVDDQNNIFLFQSRENRGNGRDVSINHNDDDYVDIYYDGLHQMECMYVCMSLSVIEGL